MFVLVIRQRWQLWRKTEEYLDKVSVLVTGGMLVVSTPSALGARLQVLGYCTAAPV